MDYDFVYNNRLGIELPVFHNDWDNLTIDTQAEILFTWEQIRGNIPDRIFDLEKEINEKQARLNNEDNFKRSCELNTEISELASIINDLWIWYRTHQDVTVEAKPVHQ